MDYDYIDSPKALAAALERLAGSPILGVDTEAAGYHRFHDSISLIQISSRDYHLLIDPLAISDLSALAPIFTDPAVEKIFHDADFDLRILYRDLHLEISSLFDTQIAAAFLGERLLGLGPIVEKYLGVNLPKAFQRADWAERPLTEGMKEYAVMDTAYLPALRDRLLEDLEKLGRVEWAREEFVRRQTTRWDGMEKAGDAFLKVKGARDLTPRGLAILREIFRWREEVGKERDQATFRVLANQAMLEISLKSPNDMAALRQIQGVSSGLADRRGRDLLAAVQRGLAVPEADLPRFPPTRRWERDPAIEDRSERLRQLRNQLADNLDLDAGFLISRSLLDEIARRNPASLEELAEVQDVRRWQVNAIGGEIVRTLRN